MRHRSYEARAVHPPTSRVMRMESLVAGMELDDTRKAHAGPGRCATLLVPPLRMNSIDIKALVVDFRRASVGYGQGETFC